MANWWEYVRQISRNASQSEIARRLDLSAPSVNRWRHSSPKPENVRAFALEYGRPVPEAMVAAGYMEPEDIDTLDKQDKADDELARLWDDLRGSPHRRRLLIDLYHVAVRPADNENAG